MAYEFPGKTVGGKYKVIEYLGGGNFGPFTGPASGLLVSAA
jgi:hypothetical protein